MDANSGFWQVKLHPECRELTTYITLYGKYCFNKMPFGISSAPESFQHQMSKILAEIDGVLCHMDDVLVFGSTEEKHDSRLKAALSAMLHSGLTLNKEKCEFKVNTVQFLGHVITGDGICAVQDKVRAIVDMAAPTSVKELKRFLGMADHLRKFSPRLAHLEAPMHELRRKKSE